MKSLIYLFVTFLIISYQSNLFAQHLLLFGGDKNEVYLGCITCNKFDNESIWNKFGTYGSKFNSESIWNKFGTYGSKFNMYSPWNKHSIQAPVVVDKTGTFYGYFTINKHLQKRVRDKWLIEILENYEWIMDNFDKYVNNLRLN